MYHRAEVFVDVVAYPAHPNGYFGFRAPVSEGQNTIRVIAHNAEQPSSRRYSGAGIYRPVSLVCLPEKHILPESIAVRIMDCNTRKICVSIKTTVIGYDKAGNETAKASLKSAQKETELRLVPETETTKQGDLLYVRLRYTDGCGTIKPAIRGEIKVTVLNGKLLALGSACPYNEKGYQTDTTDTYYGEALAIIAPDGTGSVTVQAESKHGKAQITVPVQA